MLPVLNHFMQQTGSEYLLCRCRAIESAGILVDAMGAQDPHIGPNIPGMMDVVLVAFESSDSPDLRDYSHSMFGNVAKALGEGFTPWLQRVMPLAVASCEQEDGTFGSDGGSEGDEADDEGGDESSSEDEDGRGHFNVRTGKLDPATAHSALKIDGFKSLLDGWLKIRLVPTSCEPPHLVPSVVNPHTTQQAPHVPVHVQVEGVFMLRHMLRRTWFETTSTHPPKLSVPHPLPLLQV
jgi:hypothetical protein